MSNINNIIPFCTHTMTHNEVINIFYSKTFWPDTIGRTINHVCNVTQIQWTQFQGITPAWANIQTNGMFFNYANKA